MWAMLPPASFLPRSAAPAPAASTTARAGPHASEVLMRRPPPRRNSRSSTTLVIPVRGPLTAPPHRVDSKCPPPSPSRRPPMSTLDRRRFLQTTAAATALTALTAAGAAARPGEKVVLAVMGLHGRGRGLLGGF